MSGAAFVQADVVQQGRRLHDVSIGSFGLRDPIGQVTTTRRT